jgi:hypothetical protein
VVLTVLVPVAVATLAFFIGYRLARGLPACPPDHGQDGPGARGSLRCGSPNRRSAAAAAVRLLLHEVTFRRLDAS